MTYLTNYTKKWRRKKYVTIDNASFVRSYGYSLINNISIKKSITN